MTQGKGTARAPQTGCIFSCNSALNLAHFRHLPACGCHSSYESIADVGPFCKLLLPLYYRPLEPMTVSKYRRHAEFTKAEPL